MFVTKLKMAALMLFAVGLLATGGVLTRHALTAAPQPEAQKEAPPAVPDVARKVEDKKTAVRVVQPMPGGLERTSRLAGHVRAFSQQQIVPAVSGYLKRQLVDLGSRVKKGDLLAEIDAPVLLVEGRQAEATVALARGQIQEAAARVATAVAEVKAATDRVQSFEAKLKASKAFLAFREKQSKRYQELLKSGSIDARLVDEQEDRREAAQQEVGAAEVGLTSARSNVVVMESKVESAKAGLVSAKANLMMVQLAMDKASLQVGFTQIRSSYDGIVTRRNFDVGDYISTSNQGSTRSLMTVQRTDLLRVVAAVAENEVPLIHQGVLADLQTTVLPGVKVDGLKVSRIGFSLDERTATMPIEIDVPNPKGILRPGMFINVTLHLDKDRRTFTIPSSCVVWGKPGDAHAVYVVRNDKAHWTPIQVVVRMGAKVEVISGLKATDRIVIASEGLKGDVVPVEVKKEP